MNVVWTEDAVLQAPTADVAVAVASEKGLVTPVIRDVASLSLSALSAKIKDAVGRANEGKLSTADLQGGTLTVSNLGMFGVEEFDAIINPPQAGILAVGAAVRKPVVGEGDTLEIASVLSLVLSVDHRPGRRHGRGPVARPAQGAAGGPDADRRVTPRSGRPAPRTPRGSGPLQLPTPVCPAGSRAGRP